MKRFTLISSIISGLLVLTLFWCNNSSTNTPESHANLKTIQAKLDYGKFFDKENIVDSSIVIVRAQKLIQKRIIPFTHSTLKVEKVYKGNVKEGDTINVLEFGGIVNGEWLLKEQSAKFNTQITNEDLEKAKKRSIIL